MEISSEEIIVFVVTAIMVIVPFGILLFIFSGRKKKKLDEAEEPSANPEK